MEQLRCVLCFLVYFTGYSSSDVTNFGEGCNWKQAMKACESMGGSLPEVSILKSGLGQINILQHEHRCIWVKASYERTHNLTDYSYPNVCCEVMFRDENGTAQKECVSCTVPYGYICASGSNISLEYSNNIKHDPWQNADRDCSTHSLGLPSDTNNEFLQNLTYMQRMWINGVRTLNTNPARGDGMFPACSCNGIVSLTCSSKMWTYCIVETGNNGSSKLNTETMNNSSTTVTNGNDSTNASTVKDCSKDPMNEGRSQSSSYYTTPLSISSNVPKHSSGNLQASTDSSITATTKDVTENGALIGGVTGTTVVLTMIIIIVVIFLLRRSKQAQNKNSNSQSPVNHDNLLKDKIHVNPTNDEVNGEIPNTGKQASIQIQHMEKESITYATTTKVQGSSEIARDKYNGITTNEEQSRTDLYSKVQKRPKTGKNLHNKNENGVGNEEYDKINFDESYQPQRAEHAEDMYDQTNLNCDDREVGLENVYNKAEFYHKHQNMDTINVYDKPNFSKNAETDEKITSPGQLSKYFYAEAYFHRRPNEESCTDAYDKIKLQP